MRRMSSFSRQGLVAALENEDTDVPAENPLEGAEGAETLETDMLEVADSAAEGEEESGQAEAAEDAAEALESIVVALEACAQNGGMDKYSANAVTTSVNALYKVAGISRPKKALPALESYGQLSSRVGATTMALEGIKEEVARIWKAIVDAIQRAYDWVVGHFQRIFGAAEKLEKRAEAVAKAAEAAGGQKKKETTFENENVYKALQVAGAVDGVSTKLAKAAGVVKGILDTAAGETIKHSDDVIAAIEDPNGGKVDSIVLPKVEASAGAAEAYGEAGEGMAWHRGEELPGSAAYVIRGPAAEVKGVAAMKLFGRIKAGIMAFDPKKAGGSKSKLNTLETAEIEKIAKVVGEMAAECVTFRKTQKKLEDVLKKAKGAAEKASKAVEGEEDTAKKDNLKAVRSAATNLPNYIVGPYKSVTEYAIKTGKAALDYCELSLKLYEAK